MGWRRDIQSEARLVEYELYAKETVSKSGGSVEFHSAQCWSYRFTGFLQLNGLKNSTTHHSIGNHLVKNISEIGEIILISFTNQ